MEEIVKEISMKGFLEFDFPISKARICDVFLSFGVGQNYRLFNYKDFEISEIFTFKPKNNKIFIIYIAYGRKIFKIKKKYNKSIFNLCNCGTICRTNKLLTLHIKNCLYLHFFDIINKDLQSLFRKYFDKSRFAKVIR